MQAFSNPDGTTGLLHNNGARKATGTVVHDGRALPVSLPGGAVQTLHW